MNLNRLKVNRLTNPLGFEMNSLSFSWTVEETDAKKQQWARVEVAADESFQRLLWDSGKDAGLSSVDCPVTLDLQPRTRYWWRVTVQGDNGEQATSAAAWFETSKMGEEWAGKWIAPSLESSVHPLLRRSFFLEGEPVRARVYAVGLGLYELYANGEKAGDEYLAPGCTAYDRWLQYQTYDVTGLLHQGQNTLGAMLGNGWAKGRFGFGGIPASYETGEKGFPAEAFAEQFLLRLELRVLLADGREVVLGTDDTWQCAPSPVTFSSIYDGERYEQAREIPHWAAPEPDSRLGRAKATVNSPAGLYESGWQYEEDGSLTYTFAIPFDGEGALVLPNADLEQLTINGVPAKAADVAAQQDGAAVKAVLPAGRYVVRQAQ